MKNKLITMTIVLLGICTGSCMAAVTQTEYEKNSGNNTVTVKGTAGIDEQISVHIVKNGEITDSNIEQSVAFVSQSEADADGEFCFVAEVTESGKYNIYVSGEDINSDSVKMPVDFYNSADYSEAVTMLNNAANESEFCEIMINNLSKLGFDDEINNIVSPEKTGKTMYSGLNGRKLSADSYKENIDYYKNCAMIVAANDGKLENISDYAGNIIERNKTLFKYWNQYITSEEKEKFTVGKLNNRKINNINELEKNISEALILTATYYPDGYMSLKELYSDFKDILGIDKISSNSAVYKKLAGTDFDDIDDLADAYEKSADKQNTGGGSGGSGGSSGGSKITIGGSAAAEIPLSNNKQENAAEIPLKFIDLGSVRWAYPSISVLFDMGIVSGVSESEFLPERNVKREEFTKMLVMALGKDVSGYKSEFSDVDDNAWYAGYVGLAFSEGIVNGVSDAKFGISYNITRQDMAVMIYRAMLSNGFEKSSAMVEFADNDSIADYAKEAVSELSGTGIINGVGDNMFAPQKYATRAESAVIIERALEYLR